MSEDNRGEKQRYTYECVDCENRVKAEHQPGECPKCGGTMENISVPQE